MYESIKLYIVYANNIEIAIILAIFTLVCIFSLYSVSRFFQRFRIIDDTPTSKIRSAHQGFVELEGVGHLMKGTPIISPLSKQQCLWYKYKIEHIVKQGRIGLSYSGVNVSATWETIDSGVSDNLFLLNDGTGICVIDPEDAVITPSFSNTWYGSKEYAIHNINDAEGVLALSNLTRNNLMHNKNYRYTEKRIDVGDQLYILGRFNTVGGRRNKLDTHGEVRDLLAKWKKRPEFLLAQFDENSDGEIDMQEWQKVMQAAKKEVQDSFSERLVQPDIHILSKPIDKRRPFIISVENQQSIINKYRWYSRAGIAGFFFSGIALVWVIGLRLSN